ncbi:DUF1543 domain-containing protein [Pontibacter cellulosilyticus]|uniref:DUF1543 domain-containing protein n=1 Tax=Pontibacter cellulosilyticus TaxID=1720253 RepID=A0A923N7N3_9BACT|nr:DUF1543 domain-containing protein [Pontibacter cellulosilyticus]MBC5991985.1 DUF1543 domain-containing protein [Pontibacter cellulosilyticus]
MQQPKLFMLMLGGRPPGRNTEQHDMFFGIGETMKDLVPAIKTFWPEAKNNLHVDAWREVNFVDGYAVKVVPRQQSESINVEGPDKLFFLNLGGYKPGEFDEFHYKMLVVAPDMADATTQARRSAFYKHTGFKGAASHIDDKYGVDVDDMQLVKEMLPEEIKQQYSILLSPITELPEDEIHLGYFQLHKL